MIDTAGNTAVIAADAQVTTADDGYVPLTVAEWLDTPDGQAWARARALAGLLWSTGSPSRPYSHSQGVFAEIKVDSGLSWGSAWTCRLSADQELLLVSNDLGLGLLPDLAHLPSPG